MKYFFRAVSIVCFFCLQSCVTVESGKELSYEDWESLKVAETSKNDVIDILGKPDIAFKEYSSGKGDWALCGEEGVMIDSWSYHYKAESAKIGPGFAKSTASQKSYIFRFNKQDLLCMKYERSI